MPDFLVSELYVYPIKSLGGIRLQKALIEKRGLQHDRRWMLTDEKGRFISQREHAVLALLQVEILPQGLLVTHKKNDISPLLVPFAANDEKSKLVSIWDDVCFAFEVNPEADKWFSEVLGFPAKLVHMPENAIRPVDPEYGRKKDMVSFADAFPFLIIGQEALNDLNARVEEKFPMNRFRPNIVFTGGEAFAEDSWTEFTIGATTFYPVKLCARCQVTTINQQTGIASKEPLKTLASYRTVNNKVMFGQNLIHNFIPDEYLYEGQELVLID